MCCTTMRIYLSCFPSTIIKYFWFFIPHVQNIIPPQTVVPWSTHLLYVFVQRCTKRPYIYAQWKSHHDLSVGKVYLSCFPSTISEATHFPAFYSTVRVTSTPSILCYELYLSIEVFKVVFLQL